MQFHRQASLPAGFFPRVFSPSVYMAARKTVEQIETEVACAREIMVRTT